MEPTKPPYEKGKFYTRVNEPLARAYLYLGLSSEFLNDTSSNWSHARRYASAGYVHVFLNLRNSIHPTIFLANDLGDAYDITQNSPIHQGKVIKTEWTPPVYSYINVYKGRPLGSAFTDIELSVSEAQNVVKEGEFEYLQTLKIEPISSSTATFKHEAAKVFGLKK